MNRPHAPITRVDQVDWDTWEAIEHATLLFVLRRDRVLLIEKKRGLGAGKVNGPGGRIEPGESPLECAVREVEEELRITPLLVEARGELRFQSDDFPTIHGYVFVAKDYRGQPEETSEAVPLWTPIDRIPYGRMWEDDLHWLPHVLAGHSVDGRFVFEGESLLDYSVEVIPRGD